MEDLSERVHQARKPYRVHGYDDEFTVLGTGQVIPNIPPDAADVLRPSLLLSASASPVDSPQSFYLCMVAAVFFGAALMHVCSQWLKSSSSTNQTTNFQSYAAHHSSRSASKIRTASRGAHPSTNNGQHLQSVSIVKTTRSVRVEKPVAVPGLVPEDNNIVVATKPVPTTAMAEFNESTLTFPMKKEEIPVEDLRAVVNATVRLQEEFDRYGRTCGTESAANYCVEILKVNKTKNAELDKERRGYIFDSHQRNIDRSLEERRHREKLAAGREDRDWLVKLRSEHEKALKALGNAIAACLLIYLAGRVIIPLVKTFQYWRQASLQELMCGRAQVEAPVTINYTTYWDIFSSFSDFAASKVKNMIACFNFRASQFYHHVGILIAMIVGPWVFHLVIPLPKGSKRTVTSVLLVAFFRYEDWIPDFHVKRLGLCVCPIGLIAWGCLRYQYDQYKGSFTKSPPSVAQVSECAEWFANAVTALYMAAVFGVAVWGVMVTMILGL